MFRRMALTALLAWAIIAVIGSSTVAARQTDPAVFSTTDELHAVQASAFDASLMRSCGRIYRLEADSTYRNACFDPCDCIQDLRSPLSGTMQMRLVAVRPCEREYSVLDVNFRIRIGGSDVLVRGFGRYTWSCSLGPLTVLAHRLTLSLRIGEDGPVQRFDSELIAGASDGVFPPIRIVLDKNNQVCIDEVLTLNATPVLESSILGYRLLDGSSYQEGCFDPCACPIAQVPVGGGFTMVSLPSRPDTPAVREWAVVRVGWMLLTPASGVFTGRVGGSGFYMVTPAAVLPYQERMLVSLLLPSRAGPVTTPTREREWDSGWVGLMSASNELPPPRLDIDVAVNGFYCYDQVFSIRSIR